MGTVFWSLGRLWGASGRPGRPPGASFGHLGFKSSQGVPKLGPGGLLPSWVGRLNPTVGLILARLRVRNTLQMMWWQQQYDSHVRLRSTLSVATTTKPTSEMPWAKIWRTSVPSQPKTTSSALSQKQTSDSTILQKHLILSSLNKYVFSTRTTWR